MSTAQRAHELRPARLTSPDDGLQLYRNPVGEMEQGSTSFTGLGV
jgi:hypothetical protein